MAKTDTIAYFDIKLTNNMIKPEFRSLPNTNTLAYFASASRMKENIPIIFGHLNLVKTNTVALASTIIKNMIC